MTVSRLAAAVVLLLLVAGCGSARQQAGHSELDPGRLSTAFRRRDEERTGGRRVSSDLGAGRSANVFRPRGVPVPGQPGRAARLLFHVRAGRRCKDRGWFRPNDRDRRHCFPRHPTLECRHRGHLGRQGDAHLHRPPKSHGRRNPLHSGGRQDRRFREHGHLGDRARREAAVSGDVLGHADLVDIADS